MKKIVLLHEELGTQMQIYLALCDVYRVEIAENIESAMYMLRKFRPEILLLDYNLSYFSNGKKGVDFIRKIKRKYHDLKVVVILEGTERQDVDAFEGEDIDSVICKPIKNRNLISNVKKLSTGPVMSGVLNP